MENLNQFADQLRPIQLEGLRAILSEKNYTAAAARVGVSRVTLWRWLQDPVFEEAVKAGRQAQIDRIWADIKAKKI